MGSSSILPVNNSWWARLMPTSGKKHLFLGDDKEEKEDRQEMMWLENELFDDNILRLLSRNFWTAFMLGKRQRDPLPF
jgi:hypothetical protein